MRLLRLSVIYYGLAERVGFEPTRACTLPLFESGTFDHSDISPRPSIAYLQSNGKHFSIVTGSMLGHIWYDDRIWLGEEMNTSHTCLVVGFANIDHNHADVVFTSTIQSRFDQRIAGL